MAELTGRIHEVLFAIKLQLLVRAQIRQIVGTQLFAASQSFDVSVYRLVARLHLSDVLVVQFVPDKRQLCFFRQFEVHIIVVLTLRQTLLELLALQLEFDRITVQRPGRMLSVEFLEQLLDRFEVQILRVFAWWFESERFKKVLPLP